MKAVVLGGTGFIGSHVVERLAARGDAVLAVSRKGTWPWGDTPRNVHLAALDVAEKSTKERLIELLDGAETIVNLSGVLDRTSLAPHALRRVHVNGAWHVVDALSAARSPRTRLIHVSTTGVLGPTGTTPKDEEAPPHPTNEYERAKLEGETIALASRRHNREVAIVRPGLVYGPRDLHLLAWFQSIAQGRYRPIGAGDALWQPVYVDDVVRGIEAVLATPGADGQTFHLAGTERVTVADLGKRIASTIGKPAATSSIPYPLAMAAGAVLETILRDPPLSRARVRTMTQHRVYAIDRAQTLLSFTPNIPLSDGLERTVAWYRNHGHLG